MFDETKIYGFGRKPKYYRWTTPIEHQLFAANKPGVAAKAKPGTKGSAVQYQWTSDVPLLARAMVLADGTLFIAGPADTVDSGETVLPSTAGSGARICHTVVQALSPNRSLARKG